MERSINNLVLDQANNEYVYSYYSYSKHAATYMVVTQRFKDREKRRLISTAYTIIPNRWTYGFTGWVHEAGLWFPTFKSCPDFPIYLPWHKYRWWVYILGGRKLEHEESPQGDETVEQSDGEIDVIPPEPMVTESGCSCELRWRVPPVPEEGFPEPSDGGRKLHFSELARNYWKYMKKFGPDHPLTRMTRINLRKYRINPNDYNEDGWAKTNAQDDTYSESRATTRSDQQDQMDLAENFSYPSGYDIRLNDKSSVDTSGSYDPGYTPSSYATQGSSSSGHGPTSQSATQSYGSSNQGYSTQGFGADGGRAPSSSSPTGATQVGGAVSTLGHR